MGEATKLSEKRGVADGPNAGANSYLNGLRPISRRWFPAAVFFTGIVLTLLAAYYASRTIQLRTRAQFETAALRTRTSIRARFEMYDALLHGTAGFIAVEKQVTRERFRKYVEQLAGEVNYPGVQAVGFAPRVPVSEKDAMVAVMRQEGEMHYRIWPETGQADFFPVAYIEPEGGRNETAIGFDMFTEPTRREAMERARDTGRSAASGKVTLIASEKQPGFVIFFPVYEGGAAPETAAERKARLQGFVFCAFRTEDLFTGILNDETMPAELEIFDGRNAEPTNLLFRSATETAGRSAVPRGV